MPFDYDNMKAGNVTLNFNFDFGFNGGPTPVSEFMDIQGGPLCYDCKSRLLTLRRWQMAAIRHDGRLDIALKRGDAADGCYYR